MPHSLHFAQGCFPSCQSLALLLTPGLRILLSQWFLISVEILALFITDSLQVVLLSSQCSCSSVLIPFIILLPFCTVCKFIYVTLYNLCSHYIFFWSDFLKGGGGLLFPPYIQKLSLCSFNWLIGKERYKLHSLLVVSYKYRPWGIDVRTTKANIPESSHVTFKKADIW